MKILIIIATLALSTKAFPQEEAMIPDIPFHLPLPAGWYQEAFPLSDHKIDLKGIEDVRFAPGFFENGTEDMWSYVFVWWIEEDAPITKDSLERDLEKKFRNLTARVLASSKSKPENPIFKANISSEATNGHWLGYVETYDAFVSKENLKVNLRVSFRECMESNKAVIFEMSPQPLTHEIWRSLEKVRDGFSCQK